MPADTDIYNMLPGRCVMPASIMHCQLGTINTVGSCASLQDYIVNMFWLDDSLCAGRLLGTITDVHLQLGQLS